MLNSRVMSGHSTEIVPSTLKFSKSELASISSATSGVISRPFTIKKGFHCSQPYMLRTARPLPLKKHSFEALDGTFPSWSAIFALVFWRLQLSLGGGARSAVSDHKLGKGSKTSVVFLPWPVFGSRFFAMAFIWRTVRRAGGIRKAFWDLLK